MTEASPSPIESAVAHSIDDELERARAERDAANRRAEEYLDLLRQTRSDLAGFRRLVEASRIEHATKARVDVLVQMLPLLDELQRALKRSPAVQGSDEWNETAKRIEQRIREVLDREGLQRIEADGALFNPWEHEAVQYQASPELDDQRVLEVIRDGYRIGDRVILPAQVVVARRSA